MKILEKTVFPSDKRTILIDDENDLYGGAHKYHVTHCLGFENGETQYDWNAKTTLQFVHKIDDKTVVSGLQSEQLVLLLLDRHEKLNAKYPSLQYPKMKAGLEMFLEACKERVEARIAAGVMGKLTSIPVQEYEPKFNPITGTNPPEKEIVATKELRRDLDTQLQKMKGLVKDETAQQAIFRLKESIMWLGMHLKELGTPAPYPNSYNPANTTVDKTADGLKL